MTRSPSPLSHDKDFPLHFREFAALMAALISLNALSTDLMLPALPAIGASLNVADPNLRQWVITTFFLGAGVGSLFYGSLSDRYGRRPVILTCLMLMMGMTLLCAVAKSFALLLAARFACGFFAAAMRVLTVSIVRDRFAGDRMARVMSIIFIVFIIVPVLAPSIGQLVLLIANWRWTFWMLAIFGLLVLLWTALRLPETLKPENRVEIQFAHLAKTLRSVVTHRQAFGYMIGSGVLMSMVIAFLTSSQQIFSDVFGAADIFPLIFAGIAGATAIGSFVNQRLVERLGSRRLAHGALVAYILIAVGHVAVIEMGWETLASFSLMQAAIMLSFAFSNSNLSAISMEPFAKGAGMAASFQAFLTSIISALLGSAVGAQFDGTTLPMALGLLAFGVTALAIIAWAEKG